MPAARQRASQPFFLNPTGTLLRRHLAHFLSAFDIIEGVTFRDGIEVARQDKAAA